MQAWKPVRRAEELPEPGFSLPWLPPTCPPSASSPEMHPSSSQVAPLLEAATERDRWVSLQAGLPVAGPQWTRQPGPPLAWQALASPPHSFYTFTPRRAGLRESLGDRDGDEWAAAPPAWEDINLVSPRPLVLLPKPPWHQPAPERT